MLSGQTVAQICEYHRFDPTAFLLGVAKGTDHTEDWTKDDRLRAATKLHDSIHNNKPVGADPLGETLDGQFNLLFVEDPAPFALPGAANAEGAAQVVREEPVQRVGDSQESR